jgi:hypothetical protein
MSDDIRQSTFEADSYLSQQDEEDVLRYCSEIWQLGEQALQDSRKRKKKLVQAYECQHDDVVLNRQGSKAYLPWVYTAHESAQARLTNVLFPNDEDVFDIIGETSDDEDGCQLMSDYLKSVFKEIGFQTLFDDALKELLFGEVVIKLSWKKEIRNYSKREIVNIVDAYGVLNPALQTTQEEEVLYNGIKAETIPSEDFVLFPISGDLSRSTCAHRVWRHKDELMAIQEAGIYANVQQIPEPLSHNGLNATESSLTHQQGLAVKEFWIPRIKIGQKLYRNMIATIVEDKYLIRFSPNPYDYGMVPFIYCPLIKDFKTKGGLQKSGHGLTDRALEIQKIANFIANQVLDESKIKLYGLYKYKEDGSFNPATFVSRPGGLIRVDDLNNIQPINPNIGQLSFGLSELGYLENQFDQVTGVPRFLKGTPDYNPNETATSKRLQAEGADNRFRAMARRVNEQLLKPFIYMAYVIIRQYAMTDETVLYDIARKTQISRVEAFDSETNTPYQRELSPMELFAKMPAIPPLSKIDINIIGFENVLTKQDKAFQFERFLNGLQRLASLRPDILNLIQGDEALESYARYLSVDKDILFSKEELQALLLAQLQADKEKGLRDDG